MDLKKYKFQKLSISMPTDKRLLEEAKARGFLYGSTPHNDLFSKLFFKGGTPDFKKDLDPDFKAKAFPYLRMFMGSFEPKHEHKDAICSMLLSELANP